MFAGTLKYIILSFRCTDVTIIPRRQIYIQLYNVGYCTSNGIREVRCDNEVTRIAIVKQLIFQRI